MTTTDDDIAGVYKPRTPENTPFHNCVENHFEALESVWDDLYAPRYGFWRPYIKDVIYRYLNCGDFLNFNPHLHAIVTDGCFLPDGTFVGVPCFHAEDLEVAFQYEV